MKKILSFFTSVLMLLTVFPVSVFAENSGEFRYSVLSEQDKTCRIGGCDSNAWNLTIPAEIDGYKVTVIDREAFCGYSFGNVILPDTLEYIGRYAFYSCQNLSSIHIPNGVTYIDDHAFFDCPGISCVAIPNSVTVIEAEAFGYYTEYGETVKGHNFTVVGSKGSAAEVYAEENGFEFVLLGDVNADSTVNTVDARYVLQAASGMRELQLSEQQIADVNQDGKINTIDARWILQAAAGLRTL